MTGPPDCDIQDQKATIVVSCNPPVVHPYKVAENKILAAFEEARGKLSPELRGLDVRLELRPGGYAGGMTVYKKK